MRAINVDGSWVQWTVPAVSHIGAATHHPTQNGTHGYKSISYYAMIDGVPQRDDPTSDDKGHETKTLHIMEF
jgi:hypothetical protein